MRERGPGAVRLVGHGSSDNAASYGVYAFGLLPGWTALRDSISLSVYYGAELDLARSCVVALSQSGRTPDVVEYAQQGARAGCVHRGADERPRARRSPTPARPCCPLGAGPEHAVAATKTYTTQVAALALLAGCAAGEGARLAAGSGRRPSLITELLPELERRVSELAVTSRVRRPDVRDRPRPRVRDRARDLAQAARDVPRRGRAADGDRSRARSRRGPRRALPGLGDRLRRRRASAPCARRRERVRAAGATLIASGTAAAQLTGAAYVLAGPRAADRPARAAALRRARPAAGLGARAGEGARPGPPGRAEQGHARALSVLGQDH